MSGLEVVGLVTGIVSAFSGAASLYRDWRKGRKERKQQQANDRLELVVKQGGPDVQGQYDQDFERLGPAFARGDHIGQNALLQQLVTLQQTVISLLSNQGGNRAFQHIIHPDHDVIYQTATSARSNALTALGQQAQRVLQAAPLRPSPSSQGNMPPPPTPRYGANSTSYARNETSPVAATSYAALPYTPQSQVRPAIPQSATSSSVAPPLMTPRQTNNGYNCFGPMQRRVEHSWPTGGSRTYRECTQCSWSERRAHDGKAMVRYLHSKDCFIGKFHLRNSNRGRYRCFICQDGVDYDLAGMATHCWEASHSRAEICNDTCVTPGSVPPGA